MNGILDKMFMVDLRIHIRTKDPITAMQTCSLLLQDILYKNVAYQRWTNYTKL